MAKKTVVATPASAPAKETIKGRLGKVVAKGKDFGNTVATKARAAGTAAKAHVGRNKAAYIAGGLGAAGLAAGTTGIALASRKKQPQDEG